MAMRSTPVPATAAAVEAYGGWTRSDVGLHAEGEGIYLGVGNDVPMTSPVLDFSYSLEYVQKKGSQPTAFADPIGGPEIYEDSKVTLHYLQRGQAEQRLFRSTLADIESQLPNAVRIHRSFLINSQRVEAVEGGFARLRTAEGLTVTAPALPGLAAFMQSVADQ